MARITINTDTILTTDREEFWHEALGNTFAPVELTGWRETESPFACLQGGQIGRVLSAQISSTRQRHVRTARQIRHADAAYFQMAVLSAGAASLHQDGRTARLAPGDLVVWENTRPFVWEFPDEWSIAVLSVPADAVNLTSRERTALSAQRLPAAGLTGVVGRFVSDITRTTHEIPADQSEEVLAQASDLAITLLRASRGAAAETPREAVATAKRYIQSRWRDPALDPREIAAAAGISPRYLHRLFQAEHLTVGQHLRSTRLAAARAALLNRSQDHRTVADIAHSCGFGDLSGFNRAFRAAYGITPTQMRHRDGDH